MDLFEADLQPFGGDLIRFHSGTNGYYGNVIWKGNQYQAYPIAVEGFESKNEGTYARPSMAVSGMYMTGASMILGGVAQMLAPKPKMSEMRQTDNGRQNTYFSSLDNMVANGNTLPVLYGEMQVGSRVISQEVSTADEGDGGQVVVIGR
ncbi:hypothetical protein FT926_13675 [Salmonella enterica]|nr:hypothetical protein [Salmonella enterica]ECP5407267.1 hypothetical protein [Salmonella enterica]